jgi:hypothetical protein
MSGVGWSRHFAVVWETGSFRTEADMAFDDMFRSEFPSASSQAVEPNTNKMLHHAPVTPLPDLRVHEWLLGVSCNHSGPQHEIAPHRSAWQDRLFPPPPPPHPRCAVQ